eukprot:TRINITY_DN39293_c0_g1_i2.p1 TRINITY_DN39293_c0_g1~~TRINITY_DN39293_c0_g1_i2.p1  ORF type:complete len:211 (+),score=12.37 TRINITY_DN39293_c0_g1_i2:63-695(+)
MLCYISSPQHNRRLSCNWFDNKPLTTHNREGWERWRVVQVGGGHVSLQSVDRRRCLGSNSEGRVFTHHEVGKQEKWRVEESPHGGVFINSVQHGKLLACNKHGHIYTHKNRGGWETWVLEVITNVRLSSPVHDLRLGCNWFDQRPFSTKNRAGWEEWRMVFAGDGKKVGWWQASCWDPWVQSLCLALPSVSLVPWDSAPGALLRGRQQLE